MMTRTSRPLRSARAGAARRPPRPRPFPHGAPGHTAPIGQAAAHRLLWQAGMGSRAGELSRLASMTRVQAVRSLTRTHGASRGIGPQPHDAKGNPLAPYDRYGHDHLWWLDRMVRSNQPPLGRMTPL